ncbi:hypothetical protein T492DRAFT_1009862 [Pavlovales sp. CCMP2436]|nr:hypothetical protein T492DRAFT_1009862 [Pavlovales sp. CCMP2436]
MPNRWWRQLRLRGRWPRSPRGYARARARASGAWRADAAPSRAKAHGRQLRVPIQGRGPVKTRGCAERSVRIGTGHAGSEMWPGAAKRGARRIRMCGLPRTEWRRERLRQLRRRRERLRQLRRRRTRQVIGHLPCDDCDDGTRRAASSRRAAVRA